MGFFVAALMGAAIALVGGALLLLLLWRPLANGMVDGLVRRILSEPYASNLWELVAGFGHHPVMPAIENEMRAHSGQVLHRPMGTARRPHPLTGLMFSPAQLCRSPLPPEAPVDTAVTLGPHARHPLVIQTPLLVSAIGYGVGVNEHLAAALAGGATLAGTAYNSGQGPLLPEVRQQARLLIVQYTGTPWTTDDAVLRQADFVEIRVGQGAWGGMGGYVHPEQLAERSRTLMGVAQGQGVTLPSFAAEIRNVERLAGLVQRLREITSGVPIGIKLAANHPLEAELDLALAAGVDVIALDGAEGGTHGAPPILADDFGLPTLDALVRAVRHLDRVGARQRVSLIIGGGLLTPGDYLKALALGADAIYLGVSCLFAATHTQVVRAVPWRPPTELMSDNGQLADQFDGKMGAQSLANFLMAATAEMAVGARALGKNALRNVNRSDLFALDPESAAITGVPLIYRPPASP